MSKSSTNAGLLRVMSRDKSMYTESELNPVKELTKIPLVGGFSKLISRLTVESPDKEQLQRMEDAARLLEELGEEVTAEMLMKAYRNPKRFEDRLRTKRGTMEDKFAALEALWTKKA